MKWNNHLVAICSFLFIVHSGFAQCTLIAYQGNLSSGGVPANGDFDFVFSLYNSCSNGVQQGQAITNFGVSVSNGLFAATNDFGAGTWNGQQIWLQLLVRANNSQEAFTPLLPRQAVMSMPYAIQSLNAANAVTAGCANSVAASNISGTLLGSSLPSSLTFSGTVTASSFSGDGCGLTNIQPTALPALYAVTLGAKTMAAVGDSFSTGTGAIPCTAGFPWLIAASNGLTLHNFSAPGHALADIWPQVSNVVYNTRDPLVTFENENCNSTLSASDFGNGLAGALTLLELGTNFIPGTNLVVISGVWSNTATSLGNAQQQTPCYGVISTGVGAVVSNSVAGKTVIIGALDFNGQTNVGGSFSVTIDGVTVATNYLTNSFHSAFGLAYEADAFYYPQNQEGIHSVVISNLGTGNVAIEYIATVEMALTPPVLEVFNELPVTNWLSNGLSVTMASINARNQSIRQVCNLMEYCQFPVAMVDVYGAFMDALGTNGFSVNGFYNTNLFWDVVHPGNGGHLLYAQTCLKQLARPSGMVFPSAGISIYADQNAVYFDESAATGQYPAIGIKGTMPNVVFVDYWEPDGHWQMAGNNVIGDPSGDITAAGTITAANFSTGGTGTFASGISSLAANFSAPGSTSGLTNTNGITWIYDIAATNVTIAQFDGKTNWWDTNAAFSGTKEFIIQAGGGWTNSGVVTITGGHAF